MPSAMLGGPRAAAKARHNKRAVQYPLLNSAKKGTVLAAVFQSSASCVKLFL